jgi:DNA-binding beta-propeller fold protein YncE
MQTSRCGFSALGLLLTVLSTSSTLAADLPDFQPSPEFFKLPDSIPLAACSGVAVDSQGSIFLFHRGKPPIICCDKSGRFQRAWGSDLIQTAHGLRIDGDDNLWVTDIGSHRVLKFSPTGKLLLALGTSGQPGQGNLQFNKPTDVAFGPTGNIYVADGYGNSRVVKFTAQGGFLGSWGQPGEQPGQFNLPHTILVDAAGRILVGDRENDRIQVFDESGKLLQIWSGFAPYGIAQDKQGRVFVADGRAHKILLLDNHGKIARSWGSKGQQPGQLQLPHMLAIDASGHLFVGEITGRRFQKWIRKPKRNP